MLTQRQIRFVAEYLATGVGSRAAIAAGYSEKTARSIASELLRKPAVRAELDRRRQELHKASDFQALKVFEHVAAMAFTNWCDLFDADGRPLRGDELTPETRRALKGVCRPIKGSARNIPFVGTPYRLHPKQPALELFAQLAGVMPPKAGRPRGPSTKRRAKDGGAEQIVRKPKK